MNRALRPLVRSFVIGLAGLISSVAAQADPAAASRYYENGLQRFEQQDLAGAIIQLKNALQEDRSMLAAQLLLAQAYLADGDLGPAELAFREALRLGVSRAEVAVPMARLFLLQGRPKVLLETVPAEGLPAPIRLQVLSLRGKAHVALGQASEAESSFTDARTLDPASPIPLAAEVPMLIAGGKRDLALERAELAVRNGADFAPAFNARASVAHARGDLAAALKDYERALELDPGLVDAIVARAGILVDLGRNDEARAVLAPTQGGPIEPRAAYLLALIAERQGDAAVSAKHLADAADLVDALPIEWVAGHEQLLMVGGLAHHAGGQFEKAQRYLESAVARYPNNLGARKLLASIYLDQRDHARATGLLEYVLRLQPEDAQALQLLGRVNLAQRRYSRASELLEKAAQAGDAAAQAALGFSHLGAGETEAALKSLRAAFEQSPTDFITANALANILMRQGQATDAVAIARRASEALADSPAAFNLLGGMLSVSGDVAGARAAYGAALKLNADFLPARLNLARLAIAEGNVTEARQTYAAMLNRNRNDAVAMYETGVLEQRVGNATEAIRWFEKAVAERPADVVFALSLIKAKAAAGDREGALGAAKYLALRRSSDFSALAALAEAQLDMGDSNGAKHTLREMTKQAEFDAVRLVRVGYLQLRALNPAGATYAAQKALQGRPGDEAAMVLELEAALFDASIAPAAVDALVAALRSAHPASVNGLRLAGDVAVRRERYVEAALHYQDAFKDQASFELLQRQVSLAVLQGEARAAVPLVEQWLAERGEDAIAREMLAELWMREGNWKAAREHYERLITGGHASAAVFNNLANALLMLGEGDAVALAERALALAPGDVTVLDTLGWALARAGRLDEAMRHLRDARLRAPQNAEIRWHLAYVLARLGRAQEARVELQLALQGSAAEPWVGEARVLYSTLP